MSANEEYKDTQIDTLELIAGIASKIRHEQPEGISWNYAELGSLNEVAKIIQDLSDRLYENGEYSK